MENIKRSWEELLNYMDTETKLYQENRKKAFKGSKDEFSFKQDFGNDKEQFDAELSTLDQELHNTLQEIERLKQSLNNSVCEYNNKIESDFNPKTEKPKNSIEIIGNYFQSMFQKNTESLNANETVQKYKSRFKNYQNSIQEEIDFLELYYDKIKNQYSELKKEQASAREQERSSK